MGGHKKFNISIKSYQINKVGIKAVKESSTLNVLQVDSSYVTGFSKRGLPHTPNLPPSTTHNFGPAKPMDLQFTQLRALT